MTGSSAPCIEVTGIDGAGKSTVARALADRLGWAVVKVRPFDEATVADDRTIRAALGPRASDAFRGARLAGALLTDAAVLRAPTVFDRYVESALMWWTVRGTPPLPLDVLALLPQPALVIHLDVPVETGLSRRIDTTEHTPEEELRFLAGCAEYLRARGRGRPDWVVVDATRDLATVLGRVFERVADRVPA